MSEYNPNSWVVIRVTPHDETIKPHYRVFAGWHGGYTYGESWKLNSGITELTMGDDYYKFQGSSGSIYNCHKDCYRMSMYMTNVLNSFGTTDATIEVLDQKDIPECY